MKKKLDYRKLCMENNMDPFEQNADKLKNNKLNIEKMVSLGYYTRKALKGKPLQQVLDQQLPEAATYTYTRVDDEETHTKGTASSSEYHVEQDVSQQPENKVEPRMKFH